MLPHIFKTFKTYQKVAYKVVKKIPKEIRKFLEEEYLYMMVVLMFCLLIGQLLVLQNLKEKTLTLSIQPDPFPHFEEAAYPLLQKQYNPDLSAQAAYILDLSSHVAIYSKNENLRFAPASTTKLVTALTALDFFQPSDILVAKNPHVVPVVLGLVPGEKMTFENLLYAMLIPSANDAALTVAQNYSGGVDAFVGKMNEKVQLFNLTNTHYADPIGLNDDEDYTTVHDLAIILSYALSHPLLSQIMDTPRATIISVDGQSYKLATTNELLGQYGIYGGKTGYTDGAGEVLVSSTQMNNGHTYIIVVMKSTDRFGDTEKLLKLIQDNIIYKSVAN